MYRILFHGACFFVPYLWSIADPTPFGVILVAATGFILGAVVVEETQQCPKLTCISTNDWGIKVPTPPFQTIV
jgi:hypothetical protein